MKRRVRTNASHSIDLDEILPEYDFSRASPNKYAAAYRASQAGLELQGSIAIDVVAAFTIGFSGPEAQRAFTSEIASL